MVTVSPSSPSYPTPTSPPGPGGAAPDTPASMDLDHTSTTSSHAHVEMTTTSMVKVEETSTVSWTSTASSDSLPSPAPSTMARLPSVTLSTKPTLSVSPPPSSHLPRHPSSPPPRPNDLTTSVPAPPTTLPTSPLKLEKHSPSPTSLTFDSEPSTTLAPVPSPQKPSSIRFYSSSADLHGDSTKPVASTSRAASRASSVKYEEESDAMEESEEEEQDDDEEEEEDDEETYERASSTASPRKASTRSKGKKVVKEEHVEPQLISHLPVANDEALSTFIEISNCTYASKALGDLAYFDPDFTQCECSHYASQGIPTKEDACGEESQCVNRLMQIECIVGDCKCGTFCQNQRFQKKEYAGIDIVKTEKKGFGVRARHDMIADTFIYEYVGDVIGPTVFQKRMKDYGAEGIKHFYFMALDREVFIDATKKGGKGRFLNHSCNPNCFVAKWTIGKKMRMGIFTKRDIKKDEELTFNYNVDRYGHVAQECFCGEPNCMGFIGGKTQTDIGGMDDLYIDALGITEEVEALGLRGTKKKKSKKLDEDFLPTLQPIELDEVPKVSAAVRQAIQQRRILEKLMSRIQMTTDENVQSSLLRLQGFNLMSHILKEYPNDIRIITLDLEILTLWPLMVRNKVESSKIEDSVKKCAEMAEPRIKELAQTLLDYWESLELGYRIPRSAREANAAAAEGEATTEQRKRANEFTIDQLAKRARLQDLTTEVEDPTHHRPVFVKPEASVFRTASPGLPRGWAIHHDVASGKAYYENLATQQTSWEYPTAPAHLAGASTPKIKPTPTATTLDVNAIIAQVKADAEAFAAKEQAKVDAEAKAKAARRKERAAGGGGSSKSKSGTSGSTSSSSSSKTESAKEKKVMALFSTIVVQTMSKYKSHLDSDQFKKRAREVTALLCEKEKKHPSYSIESYDSLTPEKASKVKAFTKEWLKKLLDRKRSSKPSSNSTPVSAAATPSVGTPSPQTPSTHPRVSYLSNGHRTTSFGHVDSPAPDTPYITSTPSSLSMYERLEQSTPSIPAFELPGPSTTTTTNGSGSSSKVMGIGGQSELSALQAMLARVGASLPSTNGSGGGTPSRSNGNGY